MPPNDRLDESIEKALGPGAAVTAPAGFVSRVEARLFYAALLDRDRRSGRVAAWLGSASAVLLVAVTALFVQAVDVPAWVLENVPGVLGRIDGLRVAVARSPGPAFAAAGAVLLTAGGIVSAALRPRRA
jgi:hypothetical protein